MVDSEGRVIYLTRRERELIPLLERGMTYKEIGEELGISWMTVRCLLHLMYDKLRVKGPNARVHAVNLWREGL